MNTDLYAYIWRTFPDAQTRRANGQYSASDVGHIAYQIDDATFWRLDSVANPGFNAIPTWTQINGDELPGLTIRGAGNPIDNVTTITFPDATVVNLGNGEVQVFTGGGGGGSSAPVDAEYLTASPNATLTNERIITNTPTVVWDTDTPGQVKAEVPDAAITTPKIADKAVEYNKIQDISANRLLGRSGTAGPVQEIQIGTGLSLTGTTLSATGGGGDSGAPEDAEYLVGSSNAELTNERVVTNTPTIVWDLSTPGQARAEVPNNAITTSKIADKAVEYNKIQDVSANRLLGRSGTAGPVQEIQIGTGLVLTGTTLSATGGGGGGGGGAPEDAEYLVGNSSTGLTNERVVTNTPTIVWDLSTPGQARAEVPNGAITYNKIQNVNTGRLLGRSGFMSGPVQEIQVGAGLLLSGGILQSTVSSGNGGCVFGVDDSLLGEFMLRNNPGWDNQTDGVNITTVSFLGAGIVLSMPMVTGGGNHWSAYYWDAPASGNFTIQSVIVPIGRASGNAAHRAYIFVWSPGGALAVGYGLWADSTRRLLVTRYSSTWEQIGSSDEPIFWTPNVALRIELSGTNVYVYALNYPGYTTRIYSGTEGFYTDIQRVGLYLQRAGNFDNHLFCYDFRVII